MAGYRSLLASRLFANLGTYLAVGPTNCGVLRADPTGSRIAWLGDLGDALQCEESCLNRDQKSKLHQSRPKVRSAQR